MKIFDKIKKSLTWQLFTVTFLVFVIFISGTMFAQSSFFGKFYMNKKKGDLQQVVKKFKSSYDKTTNSDKIKEIMADIEESNNVKLAILDRDGKLKFIVRSNNPKLDEARIRSINDTIKNYDIDPDTLDDIRRNGKLVMFITGNKKSLIRDIVCIDPDIKKGEIIFALSSLQPVDEASSVIKEFYIYFLIAAVFLILILSLFYSRMIAKPLLSLNKSASKMAQLDFSQKCDIKREDEIGNLSNTLNFLSENLCQSLTSLKEANAKLESDIEKERNLEKMRKEFVAAASHELKTPISLIEGYAEAIKDGVFNSSKERDYYLDIIIDESKRMGNLVYDMLDLSQLESGKLHLNRENFYLDNLVCDILNKFSTLIGQKNIKLNTMIKKDTEVYADWNKIEQVITNFVTNAIRYTNDNGIINITIKSYEKSFVFSIENSSKPIPEEQLDKIWDRFYRIDKSGNRKLGGTGLGLAIVKNILVLHNYDYGVKNTELGVKFYFTNSHVSSMPSSKLKSS